jgi:hypothetical protein
MDKFITWVELAVNWAKENIPPLWAQAQFTFETEPAFRILIYLVGAAVLALLVTFVVPERKRRKQTEKDSAEPVVGPYAEPGESILRFADNGPETAFFGYLPAKDKFLLDLAPGYEFNLIQQVTPDDVKAIAAQIQTAEHNGKGAEGLELKTKWGEWQIVQFVKARVDVVVNNHPYIREPEDISLLIARVLADKDTLVLIDTIHRGGWLHSKAHYWVGRALEPDEFTELTGQLADYKAAAPLGPEPLPIRD